MPTARRTDLNTSHDAASTVVELRPRQDAVLRLLRQQGPMTDEGLIYHYDLSRPSLPDQSVSGLRTRRKELVEQGLVRDSGLRGRSRTGRQSIIWEAVPAAEVVLTATPGTTPRQESTKERIKREHGVFVEAYTKLITKMNVLSDGFSEEANEDGTKADRDFSAGVRYAIAEIQAELDKPRGN